MRRYFINDKINAKNLLITVNPAAQENDGVDNAIFKKIRKILWYENDL